MKAWLFLFLLFTSHVQAVVNANIGFEGATSFDTRQKDQNGEPLISFSSLLGVRADVEWGWRYLTFNLFASYLYGNTETQYHYTDPGPPQEEAEVKNLAGFATIFRLGVGPRLYLLHSPSFRLFVGGGVLYGGMTLTHDKEEFINRLGNDLGFKETESQRVHGNYYEIGMQFFLNQRFALQLMAQNTTLISQSYKTLGERPVDFNTPFYSINFVQSFGQ